MVTAILEISMVMVTTPRIDYTTKIDRPTSVLGAKSPAWNIRMKGKAVIGTKFSPYPTVLKATKPGYRIWAVIKERTSSENYYKNILLSQSSIVLSSWRWPIQPLQIEIELSKKKTWGSVHTIQKTTNNKQAIDNRAKKANLSSACSISWNDSSSCMVGVLLNGTPSLSRFSSCVLINDTPPDISGTSFPSWVESLWFVAVWDSASE